jgi:hypothetical protein
MLNSKVGESVVKIAALPWSLTAVVVLTLVNYRLAFNSGGLRSMDLSCLKSFGNPIWAIAYKLKLVAWF